MKRKVKKGYLIVITLLTLVVCTIGAIMNTSFLFGSFHDKIESWSSNGNISISNEADLDSFKDIQIESDVSDITIIPGDRFHYTTSHTSKIEVSVKVQGDTLQITTKMPIQINGGNNSASVEVMVPEGTKLGSVTGTLDVGDFVANNLEIDCIDIQSDVGDIKIDGCKGSNLTVNSDVGDINLKAIDYVTVNGTSDVGDIEVQSAEDLQDAYVDTSADVGNVTFYHNKHKNSYHQEHNSGCDRSICLKSSVGDVSVE